VQPLTLSCQQSKLITKAEFLNELRPPTVAGELVASSFGHTINTNQRSS
jgi:hypothetical protein